MPTKGAHGEPIRESDLPLWILIHGDRAIACVNAFNGLNPKTCVVLTKEEYDRQRRLLKEIATCGGWPPSCVDWPVEALDFAQKLKDLAMEVLEEGSSHA